jgi:hypothetical protein
MDGLIIIALIGLALIVWGVRQMRRGVRELGDVERRMREGTDEQDL